MTTPPGPFTRNPNYQLPSDYTAPYGYPDRTMTPGDQALFDFVDAWGRPGGPDSTLTVLPAGTAMNNYTDGVPATIATANLAYNAQGIVLTDNSAIHLGTDFMVHNNSKEWLVTFWLKPITLGGNGFNNRLIQINQGGTEVLYCVPVLSGSAIANIQWVILGNANPVNSQTTIATAQAGGLCQFAIHKQPSTTAGKFNARLFFNGVLDGTYNNLTDADISAPTTGDYAEFGNSEAQHSFSGPAKRARFTDLEVAKAAWPQVTADKIVAADWAANSARLA